MCANDQNCCETKDDEEEDGGGGEKLSMTYFFVLFGFNDIGKQEVIFRMRDK